MRADCVDPAVVHHYDLVCILDGCNTLRNNNFRSVGNVQPKCLTNQAVGVGVNRTRGIIENQNFRFFQQCPRNTKSLPLASGNIGAALLNVGIVLIRKCPDETVCLSKPASMEDFLVRGVFVTPLKIFFDRSGKKDVFLQNYDSLITKGFNIVISDIYAAYGYFSADCIIKTRDKLNKT